MILKHWFYIYTFRHLLTQHHRLPVLLGNGWNYTKKKKQSLAAFIVLFQGRSPLAHSAISMDATLYTTIAALINIQELHCRSKWRSYMVTLNEVLI